MEREPPLTRGRSAAMALVAALAYGTMFLGAPELRRWARTAAGHPPYAGPWGLIEHLLLYTTVTAVACAIAWRALTSAGWIDGPRDALRLRPFAVMLGWGLVIGAVVFAVSAVGVLALRIAGSLPGPLALAYHPPNGWVLTGNVFSAFYEEFIYRGFLFAIARRISGRVWVAVAVTSVLFGASHLQYPVALRALIAVSAAIACLPRVRTGSMIPVWIAHLVSNALADSLL